MIRRSLILTLSALVAVAALGGAALGGTVLGGTVVAAQGQICGWQASVGHAWGLR